MGTVFVDMSMSLDGYIAGPNDSQENPLGDGGELADVLGLERTTLTRSANRMEDEGWVAEAESEDARERRLKLTPAGRETVESAYPAWKEVQDELDRHDGRLETE